MRIATARSETADARTQPLIPFGRSGSWTRYHTAWHEASTRAPSTPKTVGTPLTLRRPKAAILPEPGRL